MNENDTDGGMYGLDGLLGTFLLGGLAALLGWKLASKPPGEGWFTPIVEPLEPFPPGVGMGRGSRGKRTNKAKAEAKAKAKTGKTKSRYRRRVTLSAAEKALRSDLSLFGWRGNRYNHRILGAAMKIPAMRQAFEQELRASHRELAKKYHPDTNKSKAAAAKMARINAARDRLMAWAASGGEAPPRA